MHKILFVDDHVVIRVGILTLLKRAFPKYEFLEAGCLDEAEKALEPNDIDLVLCDVSLGKESGLDLLQRHWRKINFVILSIFEEAVYARRCLDLGAKAYLNKGCEPEELVHTVQRVIAEIPVPSTKKTQQKESAFESLSDREREVLEDIANGLSLHDIGTKRGIQYSTVKTYKQRIMDKTHCKHNPELLFFALKHGLVQPG